MFCSPNAGLGSDREWWDERRSLKVEGPGIWSGREVSLNKSSSRNFTDALAAPYLPKRAHVLGPSTREVLPHCNNVLIRRSIALRAFMRECSMKLGSSQVTLLSWPDSRCNRQKRDRLPAYDHLAGGWSRTRSSEVRSETPFRELRPSLLLHVCRDYFGTPAFRFRSWFPVFEFW